MSGDRPGSPRAQPALAREPMVIRREFSQEIEMVIAPGDDFVEIVARSDGGAGQKQQDLGQRVDDPPRLPVVVEQGEMLQQQSNARSGQRPRRRKSRLVFSMRRPQVIRATTRITPPRQAKIAVNLPLT